jgi:signal transduction histidine kinase
MGENPQVAALRAVRDTPGAPTLRRMSGHGGEGEIRHPSALAAVMLGLCTALTGAVVALPFVRFGYRAPALHVSLETANALIALLVAYLVYGRFRGSRQLQDLLLSMALCTVAAANLLLTALPTALTFGQGTDPTDRGATAIRLLGTFVLTAAAVVPRRMRVRSRRTVLAVASVAVLGVVLGLLLIGSISVEDVLAAPPDDATRPLLVSDPALLTAQVIGAVLYAVAAVCLTRKVAHHADELLRWVGAACVVGVFARIHYLLYPSLYSEFVYTGDLLRLGSYLLMLIGAAREIRSYWAARQEAAVLEDRRRMARDLHDGLTQELTYISTQARRLVTRPEPRIAEQIVAAAARAVDEARQAIDALTSAAEDTFPVALQRLADDLAHRHDVKIVTQLSPAATVDHRQAEALLRITAEAVRNAVRHGPAERIELRLTADPLCLAVVDDGRGFDPAVGRPGGFGLTSMRQRAESVGASFSVGSVSGEGTTVQVTWR